MNEHGPVPVVVEPEPGETLLGYAGRMMEENGYASQLPMWRMIGLRTRSLGDDSIRRLSEISQLPYQQLKRLPHDPESGGLIDFLGSRIDAGKLATEPRYCLACFGEKPFHRALWDLQVFSVCPIHHVELQSRCPICQEPYGWRRKRFYACSHKKQHDLRHLASHCAQIDWEPNAESAIMQLAGGYTEVEYAGHLPSAITDLPFDCFLDLLSLLGGAMEWGYGVLPKYPPRVAASRRANRGFDLLKKWPANFQRYIREKQLNAGNGRSGLGALWSEICRLSGTPHGAILRHAYESALQGSQPPQLLSAEPDTDDQKEISLVSLAAELGCTPREMHLMALVEGWHVQRHRKAYFKKLYVDRSAACEFRSKRRVWFKLGIAAARLKIGKTELRSLCRDKLIGVDISRYNKAESGSNWRVREHEIEDVLQLLRRPLKEPDRSAIAPSMSLSAKLRAIRTGDLVACDWSDQLGFGGATLVPPMKDGNGAGAVGSAVLEESATAQSYDSLCLTSAGPEDGSPAPTRSTDSNCSSLKQVAKQLFLDPAVVARARRNGHFGAHNRENYSEFIAVEDVKAFESEFISYRLLLQEQGGDVTSEDFYAILRTVKAVNELPNRRPLSPGQRFYRRSDLVGLDFSQVGRPVRRRA